MHFKEAQGFMTCLANEAGNILLRFFNTKVCVEYKGRIDAVTEGDTKSERYILGAIRNEYPNHSILAEETGWDGRDAEYLWIIDPLDGTSNYVHGYPFFCVSIALYQNGSPLAGCVRDPTREETFFAFRGKGALLNGGKIKVSTVDCLDRALVATGFSYEKTSRRNNLQYFNRILPNIMGIRRDGAAALDSAYIAAGRLDGFWELKLKPWDTAAGILLVEEAGGCVSDLKGRKYDPWVDNIAMSNGYLHGEMLKVLSGEGKQ